MRELFLMRHAEALTESPTGDDFGRPLSPRGQEGATRIGNAMARFGWLPQRVLVSSAARTRQTWDLLKPAIESPELDCSIEERLYSATAGRVLDMIRESADAVNAVAIIGHNPSMHELALRLASESSDPAAFNLLRQKFPPAGIVRLEFEGSWQTLNPFEARLTHFLRPQDIAE
ncbi:SixA phosphatase family protein [Nitratireductor aestuarii]|nr:histidine phosphatase family protein [Nitratireductor aestuarii]